MESFRWNVSVVHRDVCLSVEIVIDNIRYGRSEASFEEVGEVAKKANAQVTTPLWVGAV